MAMGDEMTNGVSVRRTEASRITDPHLHHNNKDETIDAVVTTDVLLADVRGTLHLETPRKDISILSPGDVAVGAMLGSGSFSQVFQVQITAEDWEDPVLFDADEGADEKEKDARAIGGISGMTRKEYTSMNSCMSNTSASAPKYALKKIRKDFEGNPVMTALGVKDNFYEAEILSHLPRHSHIVQLVAFSNDFWEDPKSGFMLFERVSDTLKQRLARWKHRAQQKGGNNTLKSFFFQFAKRRRQRLHAQRSRVNQAGLGIAHALDFLHQHGIVYRDLKPANVGFAYDGVVKLFDFGLARSVPKADRSNTLRLSGNAGTARYMSPEVMTSSDYSLPADVYSFAILLWEICTLERPYGNYSSLEQFSNNTCKSHERPSEGKIACPQLRSLLRSCWDPDPWARPTFPLIVQGLYAALDGDDTIVTQKV